MSLAPGGRLAGGIPAVCETWVRPDAVHTSLVTGEAWLDTRLLRATPESGGTTPGGRNTALPPQGPPARPRAW